MIYAADSKNVFDTDAKLFGAICNNALSKILIYASFRLRLRIRLGLRLNFLNSF